MNKKQINKKAPSNQGQGGQPQRKGQQQQQQSKAPAKKLSEYGQQLKEKQELKKSYGMQEKQFRNLFEKASKLEGSAGENLLSMLERRLDNVVFKLKLAASRAQARQLVVHGHLLVNGKKVYSPSMMVHVNDVISYTSGSMASENFVKQVIDKRLNMGIKVPDWLELNKNDYKGSVLRLPVRSDIQAPVQESLIVELYSK